MSKLLFPQKPIFTVELIPATTVHSLDPYVDSFLNMTASLQLGGGWSTATSTNNEVELIRAIQVLSLTLDYIDFPISPGILALFIVHFQKKISSQRK